ncbi:DsbA family protein [Patescibacteria group bacterium]
MNDKNNIYFTTGAIIIAGALIASAVIYTAKMTPNSQTASITQDEEKSDSVWDIIKPVSENDYILGNPNAELTLIGYFDINCGHCRNFHKTMHQIMDEYGKDGKLKWVPKHFPLSQFSQKEAVAVECVGEIGGDEKFWKFLDNILQAPMLSQGNLENELASMASSIGIENEKFKKCLADTKQIEKVNAMGQEAISMGAQGTPFNVLIDSEDNATVIPGALTYEQVKQLIDSTLSGE